VELGGTPLAAEPSAVAPSIPAPAATPAFEPVRQDASPTAAAASPTSADADSAPKTLPPRETRSAGDASARRVDGKGGTIRTLGALAAVVALLVLLAWGYRLCTDWGRNGLAARARNRGLIEIVARQTLSPKHSVYLIRTGDRVVLVGMSPEGLRTLDTIADADAASRLLGRAAAEKPTSSTAAFQETLASADIAYEEPADDEDPAHIKRVRARLAEALARLKTPVGAPNGRNSA
jgi:flagellar biogenesis protein FliO